MEAASVAARRRGLVPTALLAWLVFIFLLDGAVGKRYPSDPVDHSDGLSGDVQPVELPLFTGRDGRRVAETDDGSNSNPAPGDDKSIPKDGADVKPGALDKEHQKGSGKTVDPKGNGGSPPQNSSQPASPPPPHSPPPPSQAAFPPPVAKPPPPPPEGGEDSPPPPEGKGNDPGAGAGGETGKDQVTPRYKRCGNSKVDYEFAQRGDEDHHLSLKLKNNGEETVSVTMAAPKYLTVNPKELKLLKGAEKSVTIEVSDVESAEATTNLSIKIGPEDSCNETVTSEMLNMPSRKDLFLGFGALAGHTKVVGGSLVLLVLVVVTCSCICHRCKARKQRHGGGPKYDEVEMSAPSVDLSTAFNQETSADGWDEVWDDEDWEDTEAARSSARSLVPSLSAKGLNSRRANKDAWDTWET